METLNSIDEEKILKTKQELKNLIEKVDKNFSNMNSLIDETIATGAGIWDGEQANQFKSSWNELVFELPLFVDMMNKQVNNIDIILKKTEEANEEQ